MASCSVGRHLDRFGHIFAKGPNREAARKSLRFALMNLDISGEIRHPVDYLVDLIETKDWNVCRAKIKGSIKTFGFLFTFLKAFGCLGA